MAIATSMDVDMDLDIDLDLDADIDPELARMQAEAAKFDAVRKEDVRRREAGLTQHNSCRR